MKKNTYHYKIRRSLPKRTKHLGGILAACLLVILIWVSVAARNQAQEAMAPAALTPAQMAGLIQAETNGVPLEAAAAVCELSGTDYADAALAVQALSSVTDAGALLESLYSGRELKAAEATADKLSWVASIVRGKIFPFAQDIHYDFADGWGEARSDDRKHEGIDIFADMGTPIRSVCAGTVEKKGWLTLGGWRIGIRGDDDDIYYYYAHMSAYADQEVGDRVEQGEIIGYVGDSGYGPEGTTGQFVAHLHFGMYQGKDDTEKAFSPYPFLCLWDPKREPEG